jgi:hypothetical protein
VISAPRGLTYAQNTCCGGAGAQATRFARYKTRSAAKLLICKTLDNCRIYGQRGQLLDFSSPAGPRGKAINKVIHTKMRFERNRFPIKDLSAFSRSRLKSCC